MLDPLELDAWLDEASELLGVRRPPVLRRGEGGGWADRNGVALGQAVFKGGSGWREVVAHELAHAVQFRNGLVSAAPCPDALALEEEAGWAAAEVLQGASARPRLAAHPAQRLHWNRFGHFYTVQFMAVAVFQLPTSSPAMVRPSMMSVSLERPRHITMLPGGGSRLRAR